MVTGKDDAIIEVKRAGVCTGVVKPESERSVSQAKDQIDDKESGRRERENPMDK